MAKSWREIQKEKEEHERQKAEQAKREKEAKLKGLQQEVQPEREHTPAEDKVPELGLVDERDRLDAEAKRLERRAAAAQATPKQLTPEEEAELKRKAKEKEEEEKRAEALRLKTEARMAEWKAKKASAGPPLETLEITEETFTPNAESHQRSKEEDVEAVKKRMAAMRLANALK